MTARPITHRYHLPRNLAADVRHQLDKPRLRERLRYLEALGYLPGDRDAIADAPPPARKRQQAAQAERSRPLGYDFD